MRLMRTIPARSTFALVATCVLLGASPLLGQRTDRLQPRAGAPLQERPIERQFRERLAEVVRKRLNLNESQMQRLGQVNDRFERERMLLLREERRARQALRAEVLAGDAADDSKVAGLLDQVIKIQRRRLDITESEQRELAQFMTATQRAKYFGIQDELRQRLEDLRQQRQQRRGVAPALGARRVPR